jgi:hypothetical protein
MEENKIMGRQLVRPAITDLIPGVLREIKQENYTIQKVYNHGQWNLTFQGTLVGINYY